MRGGGGEQRTVGGLPEELACGRAVKGGLEERHSLENGRCGLQGACLACPKTRGVCTSDIHVHSSIIHKPKSKSNPASAN